MIKRMVELLNHFWKVTCKRTQRLPTILGVAGQQCCVRLDGAKSLTGFKLCATTCNRVDVQTDATWEIQHCCVRLHGALVKASQRKGQDQPRSQGSLPGREEKNPGVRAVRASIRHFWNEKRSGAEMCRAIVCGIATPDFGHFFICP